MDAQSQQEKCKRIFARRLAEECQARQWPEAQWQKRLKEITGFSQATVSRWLSGESIPHPLARQALSREFDKLDSYWLGGKTEQEIQTDTSGGAMQLQEGPYEPSQSGLGLSRPRVADYTVYAAPLLKQMLKDLSAQLIDTPDPRAAPLLDQIEMIAATLRAKLHEARREKEIPRAQV
jgi:transcriptional regulator with XRE-family HTH domain